MTRQVDDITAHLSQLVVAEFEKNLANHVEIAQKDSMELGNINSDGQDLDQNGIDAN